ncbi:HAD-IA family hydrolase [Croceivirga thetidis]|uniref:HAD-IA family hydrolase n=1 Tax=Croceivirga thetidis TaxID=2721623 RepID=A0ABX1GRK6_9FLAO|nr:HAD-IA family hydrolase [Croceivirga thetidis]NKI32570.1 HAD-IA family hydrolase [Croceivirga thetidis]
MIKNIIFDFGDVFINLDKPATFREMQKFGLTAVTPELDILCKNYEKGLISSTSFLNETSAMFPQASKQELTNAWNAILLDFPSHRLDFIESIAAQEPYRLFLLSNTNELHIDFVRKKMGEEDFTRFKNLFEKFYLSHEIHMRKPDREIFDFVLDENELNPVETLLVDDTVENIETALRLKINCWHIKVGKEDVVQLKEHL